MKNVIHLNIKHDDQIENPSDHEGQWRYVSFNRRHTDHEDPSEYFNEYAETRGVYPKIGIANKLRVGTAFMVDVYEHGDSSYSLHGEGMNCRWDTSSCAGILLWEHSTDEMGAKTLSDRAEDARCFLRRYADWANGHGYKYSICDSDGDPIDSCGGFYGSDSSHMVKVYISPEIRGYMEEHGFGVFIETNKENLDEAYVALNPHALFIVIDGDAGDLMCYESLDLNLTETVAA